MRTISKRKVQEGVYWIEIPDADLRILCGCPADSIKHLIKQGHVTAVEKDCVQYEIGPNAILLSDELIQNGQLSNLSEFPILHMFYNQGMILPDHPNNTGSKPILIGNREQVESQMEYIFRGNYGLVSEDEYLEIGSNKEYAQQSLRLKLRFAFGRFFPSSELVKSVYVEEGSVEIVPGVLIRRIESNRFEISYGGKSEIVNLALKKSQKYSPSYQLPNSRLPNPYFGIVHIGEGNGWDHTRPCVGSLIQHNEKLYLIDSGPHIDYSLKSLGISPKEVDGIFFTHVHDDHFAGLFAVLQQNPTVKILATNVIFATIEKKFKALFGNQNGNAEIRSNHHELFIDQWNDCDGLDVQPILSPHSIDTTIFIFKAVKDKQIATYGHYSDIAAMVWLHKLLVKDDNEFGITESYLEYVKNSFRLNLDVKKIDVGGPTIHGDEKDFAKDKSGRLVLAHTTEPLTQEQLEIGDQAEFGETDVLIK